MRLGRFVFQLPLHCAQPQTPRNNVATPAAITQPGTRLRRGAERKRASAAGHAATHCIQPVHSADSIVMSRSIGNAEGQALAHFPQSMHKLGFRRMRRGLANETSPINASYGHRYRHQKFWTKTEVRISIAITTPPVSPSMRKKLSIFTSSTMP